MRRRSFPGFLAALLASCSEEPGRRTAEPLTIACAASLRPAVEAAIAAFHKAHPDIHVAASFGASGTLFAQLTQRAPFDLFLSADTDYPRKLVAAGHAESDFTFATGRLALWVPQDSPLQPDKDGLRCLLHPSVKHIALANPQLAPYGRAAEQALAHAGILDAVRPRLVPAENVAQAAQHAQSGAAQAGLVALSLTLTSAMQAAGRAWAVPAAYHVPLEHCGVLIPWSRQRSAAEQLRDWLLSPAGQEVLSQHGFPAPARSP